MASFLFIGGTGIISAASVHRAIELGHRVTVLNRGRSGSRPVPEETEILHADIRQPDQVADVLGGRSFDAVVNFYAFTPDHIETDARLFTGRTGQYVFISSASAYQTPPGPMPVTEDMPLSNPFWQYSRDKIACEQRVGELDGLDWTIVRPSHTYDRTAIPVEGGWTTIDRMRRGLPVVVHGDGTSLWTLTHTDDFAVGFVGLLANPAAFGAAFHITNEFAYSWNQIYTELGHAAGVEPELVHVASETIAAVHPAWGPGLVGDKAHTMIFDNSKVSALVPEFAPKIDFTEGARQIVEWYDGDPDRRQVDPELDRVIDRLCAIPSLAVGATAPVGPSR